MEPSLSIFLVVPKRNKLLYKFPIYIGVLAKSLLSYPTTRQGISKNIVLKLIGKLTVLSCNNIILLKPYFPHC